MNIPLSPCVPENLVSRDGFSRPVPRQPAHLLVVVVVVFFFTLTDQASTILSNIRGCQSGTWSQRGAKVNGSHHGDNPLLGPTGIQIATKSYATLQAMAPTNSKTVHQTSFITPYREQPPLRLNPVLVRSLFYFFTELHEVSFSISRMSSVSYSSNTVF